MARYIRLRERLQVCLVLLTTQGGRRGHFVHCCTQSNSTLRPAKAGRGGTGYATEVDAEMALARKPHCVSNLRNRSSGVAQQLSSTMDALLNDIAVGWSSRHNLECSAEVIRTEPSDSSEFR